MAEPTLFPYEIVGKNTLIKHNGERKTEGDKIDLAKHVALGLRHQLKPLSKEGAFDLPEDELNRTTAGLRDHEALQVLEKTRDILKPKLEEVETKIKQLKDKAKAGPAKKPEAAAPQVPQAKPEVKAEESKG